VAVAWAPGATEEPRRHAVSATVRIEPVRQVQVLSERHASLPVFNSRTAGWRKGSPLVHLRSQETTTPYLLESESVVVCSESGSDAESFRRGSDFEFDSDWGTIGRLPEGRIKQGQPVLVSYEYTPQRLDSIVLTREARIELRQGEPRASAASPPAVSEGERRLANIWQPGRVKKLGAENLFPVTETAYPEPPKSTPSTAERLLPRALEKLRTGQRLRIMAWGDSVTVGSYLPDPETQRWQEQFVTRLKERFPKANIELVTEAWGGRNTGAYLAEPAGSEHNYREKVLGVKPHLVVSEFVNDAGLNPEQVESRYSQLLSDFGDIGAEWIILTPHYVRPDWMGLNREREIDEDPRPYTIGLRRFAKKHDVALADASRRYGRLWRQGIPYSTLMLNSINHPNALGMGIFADSLMELFPLAADP